MRKFYKAALLSTVAALLIATPILAFLYQAPFTILEEAGTDYDMFPASVDASNTFMAANGFMEADALDTRVETLAGSDKPHMVADDRTLGAVPVEANSQTNLFFTTGETDLVSMDILAGFESFDTTADDPSTELGDDFAHQFTDTYVNTDAGAEKELYRKPMATRFYVSAAQELTAEISAIPGEWETVAPQLNGQTDIHSLAVYDSGGGERLYGGTAGTGRLFEWDGDALWVEVAPQLNGQTEIWSLAVFNGRLYGGTGATGRLFQWNDVNAWVEVAPQLGAVTDIVSLAVFEGQLYGGADQQGQLYQWNGTNAWVEVAPQLGAEIAIISLAVFEGQLYGGTRNTGRLYQWDGAATWVEVAPQLNGQTHINDLQVYRGSLYGGTQAGGRLFRWDGTALWTQVAAQFAAETFIESLINYNGELFGGTAVLSNLVRWDDDSAWAQAAARSAAENRIRSLVEFNNTIYGGTNPLGTLVEYQNPNVSVVATGVTTGEHDIGVGTFDRGDIDTYAAGANVAVNTGAGILPVRLLEEVKLTAAAASVTLSDIDVAVAAWDTIAGVTSRHLVLVYNAATTQVGLPNIVALINGDAGGNYNYQNLTGVGAVAAAVRSDNNTFILLPGINGTAIANTFSGGVLLAPHAFNTTNHKSILSFGGPVESGVAASVARWADSSAITSIQLLLSGGDFSVGSTFQLGVVDERYLIEEQILSGADGTFTFAGIAAGAGDLAVVGYLRSDRATATGDAVEHTINGDGVAVNYDVQRLSGVNAVAAAAQFLNNRVVARATSNLQTAGSYAAFSLTYSQYAGGINDLHYLVSAGYHDLVTPEGQVIVESGRWSNIAPVTQLDYVPLVGVNFKDGSMMSLYRVPQFVIERVTLAAPAASVTFSNIPQGYEALQLHVYARTDNAAANDTVVFTLNADAVAANYDRQFLQGAGAVVTAGRSAASQLWLVVSGNTAGANEFSGGTVTFPQYAATDRHKHAITLEGVVEDFALIRSLRWEDTAAITTVSLAPNGGANFLAGSVFELVGVMPSVELQIEIDGVVEAAASTLDVDVTDNANDWLLADNSTTQFLPYMGAYEQSGQALHFVTSATSNVNLGAIHNAATKLWVRIWFKLDSPFSSANPTDVYLSSKRVDGTNFYRMNLEQASGSIALRNVTGGVGHFTLVSAETSWLADTWYHVIGSMSNVAGARLVVDGGAAVTDADVTAIVNGGNFVIGDLFDGGGSGITGEIRDVAIGTDDLTVAEEVALFGGGIPSRGVIPADANNIWYLDEGTGVVAVDSGLDGDNGAIDAANTWIADGSAFQVLYQPINIVENTGEDSTADAGTQTTLDDAVLTQADDFWIGARLIIVTTTDTFAPQGEVSVITDFDAALDRLTFDTLTAVVDAGDTYTIDYGTLVDRAATAQDARITWGFNPTGITVTLGSMVASSQPIIGETEVTPARDILPPIGVSDWFGDGTVGGSTLTNPIRPLITAMSDNTTLTEIQVWRLMGIIAVLFTMLATAFTVRQHQGITAISAAVVLGGLVAFDNNIFPMWTLVIAVGLLIAGLVAERSPSL